jgi:serine/threonine protein kinase
MVPHINQPEANEQTPTRGEADLPATGPWGDPSRPYPFLAPPEADDEIGRLGPYRVLRSLGAGGMGIVFLADDPHLRRQVALKVLRPELAASKIARQRFLREARALAALVHDHIVAIHHVGEEGDAPYLVMPILQGETLAARLQREPTPPLREVLRIGREIATGLAAAHRQGVVHRDIKPGNVWLEAGTGRVKLLDFGLARGPGVEGEVTTAGAVLGTPAYMAPEQARGEATDERSDLFSLGCILHQLCTGEKPGRPSEGVPALPLPLAELISALLSPDPDERPASAAEVVERLTSIEQALIARGQLRRRWLMAGTLALVVLAVVGGVILWARTLSSPGTPETLVEPPPPPPVGRIEITDVFVRKEKEGRIAILDFRVINRGQATSTISRVRLTAKQVKDYPIMGSLPPSDRYAHDIGDLNRAGARLDVPVSQAVNSGEADRFEVLLSAKSVSSGMARSLRLQLALATSEGDVHGPAVDVMILGTRQWLFGLFPPGSPELPMLKDGPPGTPKSPK